MPVKWNAEADHVLLLTLLETHQIKVDGEKIVQAWPPSAGERPTARAIKERIVKIRSKTASPAKFSSGSHVNNGVKKESSPRKKTPGKPRGKKSFADVDKDDEEIISQSTTKKLDNETASHPNTEGTPCPSPRKQRAIRVKTEPRPDISMQSASSDGIPLDDSADDFIPNTNFDEDDDDEYRGE